jgi:hypothetical protein
VKIKNKKTMKTKKRTLLLQWFYGRVTYFVVNITPFLTFGVLLLGWYFSCFIAKNFFSIRVDIHMIFDLDSWWFLIFFGMLAISLFVWVKTVMYIYPQKKKLNKS